MIALFVSTTMVAAFLILVVQPILARSILPMLGGGPSVWTASLLFFQLALLAGYAYAHVADRWLGARRHAAVHLVLLAGSLAVLPFAIPRGWEPPSSGLPVVWVLGLLAVMAGMPFALASATGPLAQRWFSMSRHDRSDDPYPLYAAGNLGSAAALIAYPTVIEPRVGLSDQQSMWTIGYLFLCAALVLCAAVVARRGSGRIEDNREVRGGRPDRIRWLALSAIPASLLVGSTAHLSRDIAAIPLLWVVPLALYMLTFSVAFSDRGRRILPAARRAFPFAVLVAVMTLVIEADRPVWLLVVVHLTAFFLAALVCHGALAEARPPVRDLTRFYLWIGIGGALGGAFNALMAPVLFDTFVEYPLAIVAACLTIALVRPPGWKKADLVGAAVVSIVTLAAWSVVDVIGIEGIAARSIAVGLPILASFALVDRARGFALGLAGLMLISSIAAATAEPVIFRERTFFGAHTVIERDGSHELLHGNTVHGIQDFSPESTIPLAYYHPSGPAGDLFDDMGENAHVGLIGLGSGALSCYRPARLSIFEIDPVVVRVAQDQRLFSYLQECVPEAEVIVGDGRTSITKIEDVSFDLLVVDAFSSDAIPTHLLTLEAMQIYIAKIRPSANIAFHISNRYVDLGPVIADVAAALGMDAYERFDDLGDDPEAVTGKMASRWAVVVRRREPPPGPDWVGLEPTGAHAWTDDRSDVLSVIRFN